MIKKNVLSLAVAGAVLGAAGAANAALLENGNPVGHILLVPYFTVQNGNSTLINIVNTDTVNGKAVKVRFRGARDSDDLFDFQVFMSPGDVWTANISQNSAGSAFLTTSDKSCSLPGASTLNSTPFITSRLSAADAAGGVGTREGYVEIFNMADIPPPAAGVGRFPAAWAAMTAAQKAATLFGTINHGTVGVPVCDTALLQGIVANGLSSTIANSDGKGWALAGTNGTLDQDEINAYAELQVPSGGLMGNWTIINVPQTTVYSGEARALVPTGATRNVYSGQTATAVAAQVNASNFPTINSTFDGVLLTTGFLTAQYDFPDLSTPYEAATADAGLQAYALSASIAHNVLMNEFLLDTAISAKTDWMVSMPTRRYMVAGRGIAAQGVAAATTGTYAVGTTLVVTGASDTAAAGVMNDVTFTQNAVNTKNGAQGWFSGVTTYAADGRSSCVNIGSYSMVDREEQTNTVTNVVVSPSTVTTVSLCGEVNILSLNNLTANTGAIGANLIVAGLQVPYSAGWGTVQLNATGHTVGLPVIGQAFVKAVNPAVSAGVSGTFGGAWNHRF